MTILFGKGMAPILFVALSILLQSVAAVFGKLAALHSTDLCTVLNGYYAIFLFLMAAQSLFWLQALKHLPLNFAYPFLSLVPLVTLVFSYFIFEEEITRSNIFGIAIIVMGTVLVAQAGNRASVYT